MANSQNNRCLALPSEDVLRVMKSKHPIHIMMFGVITKDGDVMPLRLDTVAHIRTDLDREGGYRKTLRLTARHWDMTHEKENPVVAVKIFPRPHPFKNLAS